MRSRVKPGTTVSFVIRRTVSFVIRRTVSFVIPADAGISHEVVPSRSS